MTGIGRRRRWWFVVESGARAASSRALEHVAVEATRRTSSWGRVPEGSAGQRPTANRLWAGRWWRGEGSAPDAKTKGGFRPKGPPAFPIRVPPAARPDTSRWKKSPSSRSTRPTSR
ncbi:hypothetical protein chiPu_0026090 [Chiloscyllium punctatum]|uniref:Uncharacterized protein n=1 Tax=Chiloscyllium punctatum TaxID=137246 RepID=A0A401TI96_CHIPU|nr:hypothetical protein [Chiloscyllium punctatum]